MPPKEVPLATTSAPGRESDETPRSQSTVQLITFVNSQDQNSRSVIQRHTAHHSNAQRRDARLRSLRSNRPRLLQWQRRPSSEAEALVITSPPSSTSSASASPAPALTPNLGTSELVPLRAGPSTEPQGMIQVPTESESTGEAPRIPVDLMESCKPIFYPIVSLLWCLCI